MSLDSAGSRQLDLVGEFMRENVKVHKLFDTYNSVVLTLFQAFIKGGRTLIMRSGIPLEEYQTLERNATMEIQDSRYPMYLRLNCVTAQKH